jgi:hypothetical protein
MRLVIFLSLVLLLGNFSSALYIRNSPSGPSNAANDSIDDASGSSSSSSSSGSDDNIIAGTEPVIEVSDSIAATDEEAPTGLSDPVEVARIRSERSLPTGLEGQDWFWKKLSKVTEEIKTPLIPEFKVEIN